MACSGQNTASLMPLCRIVSVVKKLGKELSKDTEMLGSYPPKNEFASVDIGGGEYMEAPTGMLARGEYKAEMR